MKFLFTFLTLFSISYQSVSQSARNAQLSIKDIMKGEDFVGYLPGTPIWSEDGKQIYFSWNPDKDTLSSTYSLDLASKETHKLTPEELKNRHSTGGNYSDDFNRKLYEKYGDIYLLDIKKDHLTQVTNTLARESNPVFSGDESKVIFRKENNLYAWDIAAGTIRQLTNFKKGTAKSEPGTNDMAQWLEQDQLAYFGVLRERKATNEARENQRQLMEPTRPSEIFIGKKRISNLTISPDMNYVVYQLMKAVDDKNTLVPDFVTESGYTRDLQARPKVGSEQNQYETWIYSIGGDSTYQLKVDEIPGIYDKPEYRREYEKSDSVWIEVYHDPREVIVLPPRFSDDGKAVVVVRAQDNKDRWIMQLNLEDGSLKLLDRQRDEAWVGGPGVSGWNYSSGNLGWIDNETIWFQSEVSGYSHLYLQNVLNGQKIALTSGKFEILQVKLSRDKKTFYVTSNRKSPHEQHFYHLPVNGGEMMQITSAIGGHQVEVSPNEKWLAIRYSASNKPWELYLMPNKAGAKMEQVTFSQTETFQNYNWRKPDIIQFEARDGAQIPARLYEPENSNGAGIIFVHGAGYLQNVHEWWSSYYREYMFHNFLVDHGYTVLDIDYRGSAGYGRDWRTGIYRFMGGLDLSDQVDGAKYLVEELECDADRLGIYGGSYGGFITLMAMFTSPGTFKSGAALRSVTDWAHYNHGYTSNILNTPVEDSIAFARSSPIYHTDGLEGNLLMLHGMVDTNVQFQDVVRLSQRLIELEKESWELAVFPMEGHGFKEASSWADEYRRIFELFEETLRNKD